MNKILYIALLATLLFASCSSEDIPVTQQDDKNIEIFISVSNFQVSTTTAQSTRATHAGTAEEQQIENLYLFLFDNTGADPIRYYIDDDFSNSDGVWINTATEKKVSLNLTQAEAGIRQVYIVANCADLKNHLDGVTSVTTLQAVYRSAVEPWSPNIAAPLLMSGNATHNFTDNRQLDNVPLTRAVAKLELNISLKAERQTTPIIQEGVPGDWTDVHQYKYRFVDFDKNTYAVKPETKMDDLTSSSAWVNWEASGTVTSYTTDVEGKVIGLTLDTYLNERDHPGTAVELSLPYISGGPLPPPEFGDETYKLPLPTAIERNTWYVYDIEI